MVSQYYKPEPFRVDDICAALVKRGHDVTVLCGVPNYPDGIVPPEYRRGKLRHECIDGVNVVRVAQVPRGKGAIRRFLNYYSFAATAGLKVCSLGDFDAVMVYQMSPVMMAYPAMKYKKRKKKPVALYCLDLWPASLEAGGISRDSFIYRLFRRISRKLYSRADVIMNTSLSFDEYFRSVLELDMQMHYLPQHCEDMFSDICEPVKTERAHNFVFAGNIGEMQSVDTIIRAAAMIKNNNDIAFHIIGNGSELENCKALAAELEADNVIFHGRLPLDAMPAWYAAADAMLLTMRDNDLIGSTLPGKVQSYMAAGKPIICCAGGESARVISEAECGIVCPAEDPTALCAAVIAASQEDCSDMGIRARSYFEKNFSKELFLDKLEAILSDIVAQNKTKHRKAE